MGGSLFIDASAKLNIGLIIGSPSANGYHPIQSIFQSVSINDKIVLEWAEDSKNKENKGMVSIDGEFDCTPESTTLYKAARLFMNYCDITASIHLAVQKKIPARAGLGGGSADAAAVLILLNEVFHTKLDKLALSDLALRIGSDVPFFLQGGTALVSGRGEKLKMLPALRELGILLVCPSFGVPTPWAYAKLDEYRHALMTEDSENPWGKALCAAKELEVIQQLSSPLNAWPFVNDFSAMLYREFPIYKAMEEALRDLGAGFVSISGSGSAMYGLFESPEDAEEARTRIANGAAGKENGKALYGMALHVIKPLETSLRLG